MLKLPKVVVNTFGSKKSFFGDKTVCNSSDKFWKNLRELLQERQPGIINDGGEIETLLASSWDMCIGSEGGMWGSKIKGRIEDLDWDPPYLSFIIERHGATVLGSSRAELQRWVFNTDALEVDYYKDRYRQLHPRRPNLNVEPFAEEIVRLIVQGQDDRQLKWRSKDKVKVVLQGILPEEDELSNPTRIGRRKRFRKALVEKLEKEGWQERSVYLFIRSRAGK